MSFLIAEGGKVKKSDLVAEFRSAVDCGDPAEKEQNRELFKTFVNNLAFVKEIDGVRHVVLRKTFRHLLESDQTSEIQVEKAENTEIPQKEIPHTGEQQRPPVQSEEMGKCEEDPGGEKSGQEEGEEGENPADLLSPIQLALQRSIYSNLSVKRMLTFDVHKKKTSGDVCVKKAEISPIQSNKRYALPLRMPPSVSRVEIQKLKVDPEEAPRPKREAPEREGTGDGVGSPQLRKSVKSTKRSEEEARDARAPSTVPLEQSEHEWLVKCASGHWSQVYGLLLRDSQLAEKRDFMSGFTALHWAAKCGNGEMLVKIVDLSRQAGQEVDINVKTHGGYTPLHIAALHGQQYIVAMLVNELEANVGARDNCGKRAYHYLQEGTSQSVRDMLGEPRAHNPPDRVSLEKEEPDLFPDLSKGLHSISRLFQPNVPGLKKKHKQRPAFYSLNEDPREERQDGSAKHRVVSEAFI